jgi:hypothetical protein
VREREREREQILTWNRDIRLLIDTRALGDELISIIFLPTGADSHVDSGVEGGHILIRVRIRVKIRVKIGVKIRVRSGVKIGVKIRVWMRESFCLPDRWGKISRKRAHDQRRQHLLYTYRIILPYFSSYQRSLSRCVCR